MGGKTVVMTVSFTPGSCCLAAYKLTPAGFQWATAKDRDKSNIDFTPLFYQKVRCCSPTSTTDSSWYQLAPGTTTSKVSGTTRTCSTSWCWRTLKSTTMS